MEMTFVIFGLLQQCRVADDEFSSFYGNAMPGLLQCATFTSLEREDGTVRVAIFILRENFCFVVVNSSLCN